MGFSKNLAKLREQMKISQEVLAKKCGITQAAIWQYENGRATPKLEIAVKLADALGTTVEKLYGRSEK